MIIVFWDVICRPLSRFRRNLPSSLEHKMSPLPFLRMWVAFFAAAHLNNWVTAFSYSLWSWWWRHTLPQNSSIYTVPQPKRPQSGRHVYLCLTCHLPNWLHPLGDSLCKLKLGTVPGEALELFLGYGLGHRGYVTMLSVLRQQNGWCMMNWKVFEGNRYYPVCPRQPRNMTKNQSRYQVTWPRFKLHTPLNTSLEYYVQANIFYGKSQFSHVHNLQVWIRSMVKQ